MNDLEKYFAANTGRLIHKWQHYFEIYERHFSRFRNTDVHVVEIGVGQGGSLQMWKAYFGAQASIVGMDNNPDCTRLAADGIRIVIGDQGDRDFLRRLREEVPRIDVLIDDGGHLMNLQIATFEELFGHISANGVYLCEDLHTSYWPAWGGAYRKSDTFIEYSKNLIDRINAWHSLEPEQLGVTEFTRTAHSLHFYDSVLVIEKRPIAKPFHLKSGTQQFATHAPNDFPQAYAQE